MQVIGGWLIKFWDSCWILCGCEFGWDCICSIAILWWYCECMSSFNCGEIDAGESILLLDDIWFCCGGGGCGGGWSGGGEDCILCWLWLQSLFRTGDLISFGDVAKFDDASDILDKDDDEEEDDDDDGESTIFVAPSKVALSRKRVATCIIII